MAVTSIRSLQILDGTIVNADINAAAAIVTTKLADSANFIMRGGSVPFTADQSHGGFKITNVAPPIASTDAATKAYVDGVASGLDIKLSVRAATVAAGTLATDFENGDTIDGVVLATGDRILIKNQAAGETNGIYIVAASGAPARASDFDTSAEVTTGAFTFVEEGTANAATGWVLSTTGTIVLATTPLVFTKFSEAGASALSLTDAHILVGNGSNVATDVALSGDISITNAGVSAIVAGVIINADINASAAIAFSKLASLATGHILAGNGGVVTDVTMSGDATIGATGIVTVANQMKQANYIVRETPAGTINGSNPTFTLANTPVAGSEMLFVNGLLQDSGAGNDYTISGLTITFEAGSEPVAGDKIRATYTK